MRGVTARIGANLLWVVGFSIAIVVATFVVYVSGYWLSDTYRVSVPMPEAGGVLPDQQVTVLGKAVGQVADVTVTDTGVLIELSIEGDEQVPRRTRVQVLRRSPIGEQSVDFQPQRDDWVPAEPGARIDPVEATVPPRVPVLLRGTVEILQAIDRDDLQTVIAEAAAALGGRGATLRRLNRDALELNRTLVAGIPTLERLIDSSEPVLEMLRAHRRSLAHSFTHAADLAEELSEQRPTLSALLDEVPGALGATDTLIRSQRANLSCLNRDLIALNEMLTGPSTAIGRPSRFYDSKLDELDAALRLNRRFFQEGFFVIRQPDPTTGVNWTRIRFEGPDKPQAGQPYPTLRPIPATAPGAACETDAWGVGVNAVRQPDHRPPPVTSPGIDFAPLVEGAGRSPDGGGDGRGGRGATPATGGGAAVGATMLIGAALWLRRRER